MITIGSKPSAEKPESYNNPTRKPLQTYKTRNLFNNPDFVLYNPGRTCQLWGIGGLADSGPESAADFA